MEIKQQENKPNVFFIDIFLKTSYRFSTVDLIGWMGLGKGEVYCYQYSKFTIIFLVLPPFNIEVCNFKIPLPKALVTARKS